MNSPWIIVTLISLTAALYYTAFIFSIAYKKSKKPSTILWLSGGVCNLLLIINNYILNGYMPFVSIFQILIFLSLLFIPAYFFINFKESATRHKPLFILASAIVMTGPLFMEKNAQWQFPPALRSFWFIPHIVVYMIAYTLAAVTFLITIINLIKHIKDDNTAYYCVKTLFPFMTCGMFFGAVWANQIWGQFWSFDIKECWSLVAWLTYMLYLHCYRREKLKKFTPLLAIVGFAAVIITFLFANVIGGSSAHSYS